MLQELIAVLQLPRNRLVLSHLKVLEPVKAQLVYTAEIYISVRRHPTIVEKSDEYLMNILVSC